MASTFARGVEEASSPLANRKSLKANSMTSDSESVSSSGSDLPASRPLAVASPLIKPKSALKSKNNVMSPDTKRMSLSPESVAFDFASTAAIPFNPGSPTAGKRSPFVALNSLPNKSSPPTSRPGSPIARRATFGSDKTGSGISSLAELVKMNEVKKLHQQDEEDKLNSALGGSFKSGKVDIMHTRKLNEIVNHSVGFLVTTLNNDKNNSERQLLEAYQAKAVALEESLRRRIAAEFESRIDHKNCDATISKLSKEVDLLKNEFRKANDTSTKLLKELETSKRDNKSLKEEHRLLLEDIARARLDRKILSARLSRQLTPHELEEASKSRPKSAYGKLESDISPENIELLDNEISSIAQRFKRPTWSGSTNLNNSTSRPASGRQRYNAITVKSLTAAHRVGIIKYKYPHPSSTNANASRPNSAAVREDIEMVYSICKDRPASSRPAAKDRISHSVRAQSCRPDFAGQGSNENETDLNHNVTEDEDSDTEFIRDEETENETENAETVPFGDNFTFSNPGRKTSARLLTQRTESAAVATALPKRPATASTVITKNIPARPPVLVNGRPQSGFIARPQTANFTPSWHKPRIEPSKSVNYVNMDFVYQDLVKFKDQMTNDRKTGFGLNSGRWGTKIKSRLKKK